MQAAPERQRIFKGSQHKCTLQGLLHFIALAVAAAAAAYTISSTKQPCKPEPPTTQTPRLQQHTPGPGVTAHSAPGVAAASPLLLSSRPPIGVPSKLPALLPAAAGFCCGLGVAKSCVRSAPPSRRSRGGGAKPCCCCSCWRCALRSRAPATPPCRTQWDEIQPSRRHTR
jgi:hypothetical protein